MDNTSLLKISNSVNALGSNYRIGNLLNKNLLVRNLALMRNIGKYSLYSQPLFPEIGMVYNVYERLLQKPEDIGLINGLIGYNNGIDNDNELLRTEGVRTITYTPASEKTNEKKKKGKKTGDNEERVSEPTSLNKIIYTSNSDSVLRSGGDVLLGEVMSEVNKIFLNESQYIPSESINSWYNYGDVDSGAYRGYSVLIPTILKGNDDDNISPATFKSNAATGTKEILVYKEGTAFSITDIEKEKNYDAEHQTLNYYDKGRIEGVGAKEENVAGALLKKTNSLFKRGMINSIVGRFYAEEGDGGKKEFLSRGRNLLKKDRTPAGGGYDNPYCRVWTVHHQYSTMKDLIRPKLTTGGNFTEIVEVQKDYGKGLRPQNGAKRLSDESVLKPNGFVNFAPHKNKDGNIDINSIKKCMFSIENLAWKDIQVNSVETERMTGYQYDSNNKVYRKSGVIKSPGPTLTQEQIGPNGGRIMWFPPYNLKFSEDIVTNWNSNTFIGRGENIYTYVNTERSGSLSFTLLIDHPSIINKWNNVNNIGADTSNYENELSILRFFTGCDDLGDVDSQQTTSETISGEEIPNTTPKEAPEERVLKSFVFFPNYYTGNDNVKDKKDIDAFLDYLYRGKGNKNNIAYESQNTGTELTTPITGSNQGQTITWYYNIDKIYKNIKLTGGTDNYKDLSGYSLNNFSELDAATKQELVNLKFLDANDVHGKDYVSFHELCQALLGETLPNGTTPTDVYKILNDPEQIKNITQIEVKGYASKDGHKKQNNVLSQNRANTIIELFKTKKDGYLSDKVSPASEHIVDDSQSYNSHKISEIHPKVTRSALILIHVTQNKETPEKPAQKKEEKKSENRVYKTTRLVRDSVIYDNEYTFFKDLNESDSFIKEKIIEKVQYFDPAFHSVTPEGFNARLTFLNQCTRQGPTVAASDKNGGVSELGVGNLAFGRAPYCVLRIGDFYNTKILIESVNINYESSGGGVQWDLNPEGVGVQPMMAEVQIRFKFIGGTDLSGPIERLQNAVSFNYYSNASVYDRRADYRDGFIGSTTGDTTVHYFDPRTINKTE